MNDRILLVEDNPILRENLAELLQMEGFRVTTCSDRTSALQGFDATAPDLAILDITLGEETEAGFVLCAELRQRSEQLPIIFFTSHDNDIDRISGMRLGVDDYLTKDISTDYLVIRIKALLQRIAILRGGNARASAGNGHNGAILEIDRLRLDTQRHTASWQGEPLDISLTQFWILQSLVQAPGQAKSLQQLMSAANLAVQPNTIAAHIKNLRAQFRRIDPGFNAIRTERGIGYRWYATPA